MFWARLRLFWEWYWLYIVLILAFVVSCFVSTWYLAKLAPETRDYLLGINVSSIPFQIIQTLIFVGMLYMIQTGGFAKLKKPKIDAEAVNVKFSDVIGLHEAKKEAWEVVQLIKDRTKLKKIGGKILRGLLMIGPPGCGKTMMAKAIATEAGIPFLSIAGSEFVEIYVGVGASRVRSIFSLARAYARAYGACIIFIDELEVVGRSRVYNAFGGSEETNSTLNQMLVEMDGLNDEEANVVVVGATNAAEGVLDAALLRPGRFDRHLYIGRPNLQERYETFKHYAKKIKVDASVDFGRLARKAVYKTPAEIQNILQEASLIAIRNKREAVTYKDCSQAIERIELGAAHRLSMTPQEREMVAYHEAGHLVILYLTHPTDDVFKASIIQRGGALGVVHHISREELHTSDRNRLYAHIRTAIAGYAAERMKQGVTTTGVSADFTNAMNLANGMVWQYGMGPGGFIGDQSSMYNVSEKLKEKLNDEVNQILTRALTEVDEVLKSNWVIVERFVKELLVKEELDYDEIAAVFIEYGKPPKVMAELTDAPTEFKPPEPS